MAINSVIVVNHDGIHDLKNMDAKELQDCLVQALSAARRGPIDKRECMKLVCTGHNSSPQFVIAEGNRGRTIDYDNENEIDYFLAILSNEIRLLKSAKKFIKKGKK